MVYIDTWTLIMWAIVIFMAALLIGGAIGYYAAVVDENERKQKSLDRAGNVSKFDKNRERMRGAWFQKNVGGPF